MPAVAKRMQNLSEYVFASIDETIRTLQNQGVDVIRMDIGSPDLPPDVTVLDTLAQAARQGSAHGYSGYAGTPAFREAIARYYQKRFGVNLNAERQILPLIGSKEGIVNLAYAYIDSGDAALVPDIAYPAYASGTQMAGGEVRFFKLDAQRSFLPDFQSISRQDLRGAKLLWLNYPNNPTGAVASLEFYREAVAFCQQHGLILAFDNPYCDVTFDDYLAPSPLQIPGAEEVTLEFTSFSKSYNMAGWRLGAACGSSEAVKNLLKIKSNTDSGHFKAIYQAAITAVDQTTEAWIHARNQTYQRRRDMIMDVLPQIGLQAEKPLASLYIWAKVLEGTEVDYIEQALKVAHVSLAPGSAYGPGGSGYIRISLSMADARIAQALEQLQAWYQRK